MNALWIVFITILFFALQAWLFARIPKKLDYHRSFSQSAVHEGDGVQLVEILRNRSRLPIPWLRIETRISPHLKFKHTAAEERQIVADQYHRSIFFISPRCKITRRHEIACLKRGSYSLGSFSVTTGDLFGFVQKSTETRMECGLNVYPGILPESQLPPPAMHWQGQLIVRRFINPDPFMLHSIRDYRTEDPMRTIHWKASAHMNHLQVKSFSPTSDPRALIVLNTQTREEQWGDLLEREQLRIEYGIKVAATMALRALDSGVEVGFASNACYTGKKGSGEYIYIPIRHSSAQAEMLFTAMAQMQIYRELAFQHLLDDISRISGADIAILSCYTSPTLEASMNLLRAAGNTVTLILLDKEVTA